MKRAFLIGVTLLSLLGTGCSSQSATQTINTVKSNDPITDYLLVTWAHNMIGVPFPSYEELGQADNGMTKYIWVNMESYYRENGQIKLGSGSWFPAAIRLEKHGEDYIVASSEVPGDGNLNLTDTKRIFPLAVQLKIQAIHLRSHQSNQEMAEAYFAGDVAPPRYRRLFSRDAKPEWRSVTMDGFSVNLPYSPGWKIGLSGVSVFDSYSTGETRTVRFGRPQDNGTYISREYFLYRRAKTENAMPLLQTLAGVCGEAQVFEAGSIKGVKFFHGGAKGCGLGFAFDVGQYTYFLHKVPDVGYATPTSIDPEMQMIIESVKE